ncbi:MAG TPA: FAD/NAD(P)-binding oxidoreductase [Candidatus Krumholzibacteria bacterium]|nr:FAD/NAD(P)-binding oxidoreductase [Candidatus Krumholzibacteria bacterium]
MHVAIVGNGVTGVTAALRVRRHQPDWKISIVSGESTYHYSRPALMYVYMGHMRYQDTKPYEDTFWGEQRVDLVRDWVVGIDLERNRLDLQRSGRMDFDKLLIATGSKSNRFGWPGQDLPGVQGLYDLMDLRLLHENTRNCRRAVIVGGGLIGIELAEMLHTQGIDVTFLVRERDYWDNVLPREEARMVSRLVREHGFDLRLETQLREIVAGEDGRVASVVTDQDDVIACEVVGLTAGVSPNLDLVRDTGIATGRGIIVDPSLRTNVENVFAAGDCAEIDDGTEGRNLIQQVWYTGKAQGEVVGDVIAGRERRYEPATWYNSAKFLDLEYQVYGRVNLNVDGEQNLYWEHDDGMHAVRIVHVAGSVTGLNFMGIRYRHRTCEQWIRDGRDVEYVLDHLHEGNFDPEFFVRHESEIRRSLREQFQGAMA